MSLYQSYRPHVFSDVVGQDFVKKILANSCRTQTFHHGYIFFGFHGIGKTTLARIFAEAVNCTNITPEWNPCHQCSNCLAFDTGKMIDVIEIDAASYTGVDNIREVIDHAKFTPTQGKFKVYIIDEVHMLSKGAFNALLKTLEEPPAHVIFLLATTEIQKVPDTILSRVIRFDLTKIGERDMGELLMQICKKENITFEEKALQMITHRARGSIRDSLTMLEKCIIDNTVTEKNVEDALHLVNLGFLRETFEACVSGKWEDISRILDIIESEGIDVRQFAAQMTEWVVDNISEAFEKKSFPLYKEIFDLFTRVFVQSRQVSVPMDILRMALYERVSHGKIEKKKEEYNNETNTPLPNPLSSPDHELPTPSHELPPAEKILPLPEKQLPQESHKINAGNSEWFTPENFLKKLQELWIKSTMIPLLKTANIDLSWDTLIIETTGFCQSKCAENSIRQVLEKAAASFNAQNINIIVSNSGPAKEEWTEDLARSIFSD
jgi:DNA polymerase III subunit gamma/tau